VWRGSESLSLILGCRSPLLYKMVFYKNIDKKSCTLELYVYMCVRVKDNPSFISNIPIRGCAFVPSSPTTQPPGGWRCASTTHPLGNEGMPPPPTQYNFTPKRVGDEDTIDLHPLVGWVVVVIHLYLHPSRGWVVGVVHLHPTRWLVVGGEHASPPWRVSGEYTLPLKRVGG